MPIHINPASIVNATPYSTQAGSVPLRMLSKAPEGFRCVPLTFDFANTACWLVNLAGTNPASTLSQLACMFVDASNSAHDIDIIFPDTGFSARCQLGTQRMIPCFTGSGIPQFYVSLVDNGNKSATDTCNIFCLNEFLPEFGLPSVANQLQYGFGPLFEISPFFVAAQMFSSAVDVTTTILNPLVGTIIAASQWYVNSVYVNCTFNNGSGSEGEAIVQLKDAGTNTVIFNGVYNFVESNTQTVINMSDINFQSSGLGPMTITVLAPNGILNRGYLAWNVGGGILIP